MATIDDFQKLDIRVGEIGIKKSCAQLVKNCRKENLKDRLVLCVVTFPPRQIGPEISEVLTLGVPGKDGECILIEPEREVPIGGKLY